MVIQCFHVQRNTKITGKGDGLPEYKHYQGREACIYRLQHTQIKLPEELPVFMGGGGEGKPFVRYLYIFTIYLKMSYPLPVLTVYWGRLMFQMQSYMSYHVWLPGALLLEQPLIFVWHLFLMSSQSSHFAPLYLGISSRLGSV